MEFCILTKEEIHDFWELRLHGLREHPELFSASYEEFVRRPIGEVMESFPEENNHFVLGAFMNEQLVGIAGFRQEKGEKIRHKGTIWGVYVNPDSQGGGIGKQLISALLETIKQQLPELEQIHLMVGSHNDKAKKLYESFGFRTYGTEKQSLKINETQYIDEDHMVLIFKK
ncbi:GNAT family N-acetyltransferase [Ectobacillus panaciterrae]|uniref:GNAT family N-acetyltransferase n=1 Tax=Ectobacillus panaciterrae TaxID=363872 RepID=UPI000403EEDB|nr:GNAT family N-acetyltransferase [Ectobacillus panaciterrae]